VIGLRLAAGLVAFRRRLGGQSAERTVVAVGLPVQAVLLAGSGDDPLRIGSDAVAVILVGIFVLCVDEGETGLDGVEFVAPDTPQQNFVPALVGVEFPTGLGEDQRNGEQEVIGADDQRGLFLAVELHRMLGIIGGRELATRIGIGNLIAGGDDILSV